MASIEGMTTAAVGFGPAPAPAAVRPDAAAAGFSGEGEKAASFAVWLASLAGAANAGETVVPPNAGGAGLALLRLPSFWPTAPSDDALAALALSAFVSGAGESADEPDETGFRDAVLAEAAAALGLSASELAALLANVTALQEAAEKPATQSDVSAVGVGATSARPSDARLRLVSPDSTAGHAAPPADVAAGLPDDPAAGGKSASPARVSAGVANETAAPPWPAGAAATPRQTVFSPIARPPRDADAGHPDAAISDGGVRFRPLARLEWQAAKVLASRSVAADAPAGSPVASGPATALGADETGGVSENAETPLSAVHVKESQPVFAPQTAPQPVSATRFAFEMAQWLVAQWKVKVGGHVQEARLTLEPEHLGALDVRLSLQDGQLTARFVAETQQARDLIEAQLGALRSALAAHGIQVGKLEVSVLPDAGSTRLWAETGAQSPLADDGRGGGFFGGRPSGRHGWNAGDAYDGATPPEPTRPGVSYIGWGQSTFEASA